MDSRPRSRSTPGLLPSRLSASAPSVSRAATARRTITVTAAAPPRCGTGATTTSTGRSLPSRATRSRRTAVPPEEGTSGGPRVASSRMRTTSASGCPAASSGRQPVRAAAARLRNATRPSAPPTITASPTVASVTRTHSSLSSTAVIPRPPKRRGPTCRLRAAGGRLSAFLSPTPRRPAGPTREQEIRTGRRRSAESPEC